MKKAPFGLSFFRDLGGIVCADGRKVLPDKLFRSGHLGKLSSRAADKLEKRFKIKNIADLRSDAEVCEKPDVISSNMAYFHFPPLDDMHNPAVTRKNRMGILRELMSRDGGTFQHLCTTYRTMVREPESLKAFKELIHLAMKNEKLLWHCTQGKDRTGVGSAILLMALGADRQTILEDYLNYNRLCRIKNFFIFIGVIIVKQSIKTARSLNNLLRANADYLNSAFDEIDRVYGGSDVFLSDALGLTDEDILDLRNMYLA